MAAEPAARLHVGTSGWHYDHWRGPFYPPGTAKASWLHFYAERFACVEVNNTFYGFPSEKTVRGWLRAVPPGFRFALKASRYITHRKKLKECAEPLRRFLDRAALFGDRLGPILFQFPPHWRVNADRLAGFLDLLPAEFAYAMEFRDPSWHTGSIFDRLTEHGVCFCQFEIRRFASPEVLTSDLVYVRLHGPAAEAYRGSYSEQALSGWARNVRRWLEEGRAVWVFFDNDEAGYAVQDARCLSNLLGLE